LLVPDEPLSNHQLSLRVHIESLRPILFVHFVESFERQLQLSLDEVEEDLLVPPFQEEPCCVGVGDSSSSLDHQLGNVVQENKILRSVSGRKGQTVVNLCPDHLLLVLSELDGFEVLHISSLVVLDLLKELFSLDFLIHVFLLASSSSYDIFEGVAESSASLRTVLSVVTHTEPAELIPTLGTGHVHATLVLLDLHLALGTGLCVQLDPDGIVVIIPLDLLEPLGQDVTVNGPMCLLQTLEAEVISTLAENVGTLERGILNSKLTVGLWAPLC